MLEPSSSDQSVLIVPARSVPALNQHTEGDAMGRDPGAACQPLPWAPQTGALALPHPISTSLGSGKAPVEAHRPPPLAAGAPHIFSRSCSTTSPIPWGQK